MPTHSTLLLALVASFGLPLAGACDSKSTPAAASGRPAAELFPDGTVQLPKELAGLDLKGTLDQANAVRSGIASGPVAIEGYAVPVEAQVEALPKGLGIKLIVELEVDSNDVEKKLARRWGAAVGTADKHHDTTTWLNTETLVRAQLSNIPGKVKDADGFAGHASRVEFIAYAPMTQILGATPTAFAFETQELLGADIGTVQEVVGKGFESTTSGGTLFTRATEFSPEMQVVHFTADAAGAVTEIYVVAPFDTEQNAKVGLLDLVAKTWGDASSTNGDIAYYSSDPLVMIDAFSDHSYWVKKQVAPP